MLTKVIATKKVIKLVVNGKKHTLETGANETLAGVLREKLGLTGTKIGCNQGGVWGMYRFNRWRGYHILSDFSYRVRRQGNLNH